MHLSASLGLLLAAMAAAMPLNTTDTTSEASALERRRLGHTPTNYVCGGRWSYVPTTVALNARDAMDQQDSSKSWSVDAHACKIVYTWYGPTFFSICNDVSRILVGSSGCLADVLQNDFTKSGSYDWINERVLDVIFLCGRDGDAAGQAFYPDKTNMIVRGK
ncbi:hypothetical protein MRB53_042356 [Persea americana]|nr:hypothetical protein MRB53_042356 [Persea americana]